MTDVAATGRVAYPTFNDVGVASGDGKLNSEKNMKNWLKQLVSRNYVQSGFLIPASSVNLNITLPLGVAVIDGHYINMPNSTNFTVPPSVTSAIWLKLTKDGNGNVSDCLFELNANVTPGVTDYVKICTLVSSGSAITSTADVRPLWSDSKNRIAVYTATGTLVVPADCDNLLCEMWGAGGGAGGGGGSAGTNGATSGVPGGAGAYVKMAVAVVPGSTVTVTVGALGTGSNTNAPSNNAAGAGVDGGDSWVGVAANKAQGGGGGSGGTNAASGFGATNPRSGQGGSTAITATLFGLSGVGNGGTNNNPVTTTGGVGIIGSATGAGVPYQSGVPGAAGTTNGGNGGNATGYGNGGGSGGGANGSGSGGKGGNGAPGLVVITY